MEESSHILDIGEYRSAAQPSAVFEIPQLGVGVALILYDRQNRVGGMSHIALPDSTLSAEQGQAMPGKFADLAIPALLETFDRLGGKKTTTTARLVGGAQLFNFGGGGGNIINIGARNAIAIRAALFKMGFAIEKADTGGNKNKSVFFKIGNGQVLVTPIGGTAYEL
jgi:chemotaxis protein CheD